LALKQIKMKKALIIIFSIFLFSTGAYAQNTSGVITYKRKKEWVRLLDKLPWLSEEEKDRSKRVWGKNNNDGIPYKLYFNGDKSIYFEPERDNEYGYSWKNEEYKVIRDYSKNESNDIIETLDKKYIVEGIPEYKWKIHNEIREIAGYLCMKAETYNPVLDQVVYAWFTDQIPVNGGPEGYYGLPGMILEIDLDNGTVIVTASEVDISTTTVELPLPKKSKGKKITREDLDKKTMEFIDKSKETERNPFWNIRY
jgi:GLPGLI family protein